MIYVDDLRLEAEVLPLFNYTHNAGAEAALQQLLAELPPSVELIQDKQAIIKGFLVSWDVLGEFSYPKIHLQEVRAFLADVSSGRIELETNPVRLTAMLLFSEEERYRTRARCVQAILFLHRLWQQYLAPLDASQFPVGFRLLLGQLRQFLERFSLAHCARAIQADAFSVRLMAGFAQQLRATSAGAITEFWAAFYQFEAYWSLAKGMLLHQFVFPAFAEDGLHIEAFYHPALAKPVKNTLTLSRTDNVVLLTGPNMAGKSTLLKAVGLCLYLAHAGVGVPAAQCRLPFFHSIVVAINVRDSLQEGYSHFMAEIQNLKAVLHAARQPGRTFAIFDELFRGTNVEDALEITRATLTGLASFPRSCFLISTHLLQLESQLPPSVGLCTYYIECQVEEGLPRFTYRLLSGWSNLRIGRLLFAREGLHRLLGLE